MSILTNRSRRVLRWSHVTQGLAEWWRCADSRNELIGLSDRVLQDIGVSRCTASFDASKPFWTVRQHLRSSRRRLELRVPPQGG